MKTIFFSLASSLFASIGFAWVICEVSDHFSGSDNLLPGWLFLAMVVLGTIGLTLYQGLWGVGFLRRSVTLESNSFDSKITVKFGDLFKQKGWGVVPVNDFFDSRVDNVHISANSLHGKLLCNYWGDNIADWDKQVELETNGLSYELVGRSSGKNKRFPIGTTVKTTINDNRFLCVALAITNVENYEVRATVEHLFKATKKMLTKARSLCAGSTLSIPVMGSGLSRIGVRPNILLHIIILAVFEETKKAKITQHIQIIISKEHSNNINLLTVKEEWGY